MSIKKVGFTILVGVSLVLLASFMLKDAPESSSWFTLDTLFHFVGGGFAAWCGSLVSRKKVAVFLVAMFISVVWEVAEHLSTIYGPVYWPAIYRYYHGGGFVDTVGDLWADFFGAVTFILLYYRYENEK